MQANAEFVAHQVREAATDRYLATLYAPEDRRRALLALHAFEIETAAVRDRISEPMPGEIRLQWWRDAIDAGEGGEGAAHPILAELNRVIALHAIPKSVFGRFLAARIFDLYDDAMPSRADLEGFAGDTASAMLQCAALAIDPAAAQLTADAAGHGGCALTIVGVLRALPKHRARGQCYLPLDLLAAAGSSREEWLAGEPSAANGRAFAAMIALGREHLAAFERAASRLPQGVRPAFLPVAVAPAWLTMVERAGLAGTKPLHIAAWRRHWLLFRRAIKGW